MRIISTSYSSTLSATDPDAWLDRVGFYTGLLEALARNDTVASIERIGYEGEMERAGVHYFFHKLTGPTVTVPARMHRLIRRWNPDLVLVNGFVFPLQVLQLRRAIGPRPLIFLLHRAEKPIPGLRSILQSVADRVVDAYLFASTEVGLEWVDRRIIKQSGKIAAIMQSSSRFQPIDKHAARVKLGIGGSPLFLWVGRLDPNKDPLTVIRAFNRFAATRPDARLYMIYTDAPLLPNVRDAIAQAPSPALIALVGTVKNKELETWYSAADFILSGSHSEGSGIAVIEAMSCGCIPIVTTIPSFRAMTADGTVGFLYPPGDAGALLDRLHHATTTDLPALGQRVRKRFERELSFPALAHKIRTLAADLGRFQGTEQG